VNTGWDLVANLIGCAVAASVLFARERERGPQPV
jgi:hypothetical protein